jgi:isocitrate dehydrogenase
VVKRFTDPAGIAVELSDISVAGRILAAFPDRLTPEQRVKDELAELGELAQTPGANMIKLPNVSASIPQLNAAIAELQGKGYAVPDYPAEPSTAEEKAVAAAYGKVLGSAVNPVLREGNSDRRVAAPVKAYAQKNPHKLMEWPAGSKTHVAHMSEGDYFASEKSATMAEAGSVRIEHVAADGAVTVLKAETKLQQGEVIDASFMSAKALTSFYESALQQAGAANLMVSLHLKATMMKISDPIFFGHAVKTYFKSAFDKHGAALASVGANPNNGLGAVLESIQKLDGATKAAVLADFEAAAAARPPLAMVDSSKGITNLHVPSDVIIDASMPVVIRDKGMMWNKDDQLEDTMAIIPDRSYATFYQVMTN